jgi:acyl transferase domain-containing protein
VLNVPAVLESEWNVKVNSDTAPWPSGFDVRRASVSSFGYGGTNGHVVVEAIDSLYPWHQHAKPKHEAPYDRSYTRPFLLCFSAHDKATLTRNVAAIKGAAHKYYLADLSYTLNMRRTRYAHRTFAIAREEDNPDSFSTVDLKFGIAPNKTPKLGFIFTGQGVTIPLPPT